jgi:adenylosuccinate lyase
VLSALRGFAERTAAVPCLAYTHFQPAQLTTVGKRTTLWMQDLGLDVEELCHRIETLRFRGCQGTTGTQASFLELFGGDDGKVRELERRVTAKLGFREQFAVTGQTYPRKADSQILDVLSGIAQSAAKMAGDLRLLQHEGELLEPFEAEQIGSSAMAYKRNPMRAERISGLARFVISLQANGAHTAAAQWLERTLDDSANRRLTLPEAFLGIDAILVLATNIAAGLEVREDVIRRNVMEKMPFMATERWLMLGVAAGGDRQALHEVIRRHSLAVSDAVAQGAPNDLLERLGADPAFSGIPAADLRAQLDPVNYTGRATRQVGEFLEEYLRPLLARARPLAAEAGSAEVRV